ncbi:S4 domain protein YaaA [Amphibacillus marinus]|uniref:S4 domain protein YaaA n=1 Tax=Amphibacillus marinus TaxID=872970 RepID=A0A1H8PF30_9BACI|nr:RNA-binding S4 domain-containing protein [Amphibacillus marinus]SEO40357.1 S4 domain protein YaaA [Amphibacillus marinus]
MEEIEISTIYIQLGQLLKLANVVESGGLVKHFLATYPVNINGEQDQRRGRKLYSNDIIEIEGIGSFKIIAPSS